MKFLTNDVDLVSLPHPSRLKGFVVCEQMVTAVNAAIASQRPLLLRGETNFPKREFAVAVSVLLNRVLIEAEIDTIEGLLWSADQSTRQAEATLLSAMRNDKAYFRDSTSILRYTSPGAIW